ncbi:MAG: peptidylprolyl isomerase [Nocardiopsaceae bacterium]|nr:peptidylprolyl isomerase [Nocardiopsaceae bacterium]
MLQRTGLGVALLLVIGLVAGLVTAFSGGSSKPAAAPAARCTYTKSTAGTVKPVSLPPSAPDREAAYIATITTNLGPVTISLANSKAPCTVNSFVHLASARFWNNTQCHRVSDSGGLYMLQCGDPTATASQKLSCSSATIGTGGPGYTFADENLKGAAYPAGTVAMANSGQNTNGSQFFLVFAQTSLPASYTPFGTITSGRDILQNVAKAGTSCSYSAGGGVPREKIYIKSVAIRRT